MPRPEGLEDRRLLAVLTVKIAADLGAGSLRDIVGKAASGDTIKFSPSLSGSTITLTSGEIVASKSLTIQGPGAALLTISGNNASRIFNFGGTGSVDSVSGLTLTKGSAVVGAAIEDSDTSGTLTLNNCTFSSNIAAPAPGTTGSAFGGAVVSDASLTVVGCTFGGNRAVAVTGPSGIPNYGPGADGGAIWAAGSSLRVTQSSFTANQTQGGFGGLGGGNAGGGAIAWFQIAGISDGVGPVVVITGDTFTANSANAGTADNPGTGGAAQGGAVEVVAGDSAGLTTTISSDTFSSNSAVGGIGGNGGLARGGSLMLDGNFASSPTFVVNNNQFLTGAAVGGRAWTQYSPGNGGDAYGGAVSLVAGLAGSASFSFNTNRVYNATAQGGQGGASNGFQIRGGQGGDARGGGIYLDAFLSSAASFNVNAASLNADRAIGGAGGSSSVGGQGGGGGFASGGGLAAMSGTSAAPSFSVDQGSILSCTATAGDGGQGGAYNAAEGTGGSGGAGGASFGGGAALDPGDSAGAVYKVTRTSFVGNISTGGGGGGGGAGGQGGSGGFGNFGAGGGLAMVLHIDGHTGYDDGLATALQVTVGSCFFNNDRAFGGKGGNGGAGVYSGGSGGAGGYSYGGAITIQGSSGNPSNQVTLDTDVLSGNLSQGGAGGAGGVGSFFIGTGGTGGNAYGGGIVTRFSGSVRLAHSSILRNQAVGGSGGGSGGNIGSSGIGVGGGISANSYVYGGTDYRTTDTQIAGNVADYNANIDGIIGYY